MRLLMEDMYSEASSAWCVLQLSFGTGWSFGISTEVPAVVHVSARLSLGGHEVNRDIF